MQSVLQRRVLLQDPTLLALGRSPRLPAGSSSDASAASDQSTDTVVDGPLGDVEVEKAEVGKDAVDPFLVVFPPGSADNPQGWSMRKCLA